MLKLNQRIVDKIIESIEKLYFFSFKESMSAGVKTFILHLGWSFLGSGAAGVLIVGINILAGRILGPGGYGKYNLIVALSQLFVIPIFFGLHIASVRAIAAAKNRQEQSGIITGSTIFILIATGVFMLIGWLAVGLAGGRLDQYQELIKLALIFTATFTFKTMLDNYLRGLYWFKFQFQTRLVELAVILLSVIIWFFILEEKTYIGYAYAVMIGALASGLFSLRYVFNYLTTRTIDLPRFKLLLSESKFYFAATIFGTLFVIIDKIVIARYLDFHQLGIYSAYYAASILIVAQAATLFVNVFLPSSAKLKDRGQIQKIDNLMKKGSLPLLGIIWLVSLALVSLFGKEYPLKLGLLLGFSLVAGARFYQEIYNVIIINVFNRLYFKYMFLANASSALIMLLYIPAVIYKFISVETILFLFLINSAVILLIQRRTINVHSSS